MVMNQLQGEGYAVSKPCDFPFHSPSRMGSSQSKPGNLDDCGVLYKSLRMPGGSEVTASGKPANDVNVGHWYRHKSFWPGVWCYDGAVCGNGRLRTLDGWNVTYGGPGSCLQAGYTNATGAVELETATGQWYDWHW